MINPELYIANLRNTLVERLINRMEHLMFKSPGLFSELAPFTFNGKGSKGEEIKVEIIFTKEGAKNKFKEGYLDRTSLRSLPRQEGVKSYFTRMNVNHEYMASYLNVLAGTCEPSRLVDSYIQHYHPVCMTDDLYTFLYMLFTDPLNNVGCIGNEHAMIYVNYDGGTLNPEYRLAVEGKAMPYFATCCPISFLSGTLTLGGLEDKVIPYRAMIDQLNTADVESGLNLPYIEDMLELYIAALYKASKVGLYHPNSEVSLDMGR